MLRQVRSAIMSVVSLALLMSSSPVRADFVSAEYNERVGTDSKYGRWKTGLNMNKNFLLSPRDTFRLSFVLNERYLLPSYKADPRPSFNARLTGSSYSVSGRYSWFTNSNLLVNRVIEQDVDDASFNASYELGRLPRITGSYGLTKRAGISNGVLYQDQLQRRTVRLSRGGRGWRSSFDVSKLDQVGANFIGKTNNKQTSLGGQLAAYGEIVNGIRVTAGYRLDGFQREFAGTDYSSFAHSPSVSVNATLRKELQASGRFNMNYLEEDRGGTEFHKQYHTMGGNIHISPRESMSINLGQNIEDNLKRDDLGNYYSVTNSNVQYHAQMRQGLEFNSSAGHSSRSDNFVESFNSDRFDATFQAQLLDGLSVVCGGGWQGSETLTNGIKQEGMTQQYRMKALPLKRLQIDGGYRTNSFNISDREPSTGDYVDVVGHLSTKRGFSTSASYARTLNRSDSESDQENGSFKMSYKNRRGYSLSGGYSLSDSEVTQSDGTQWNYSSNVINGQVSMRTRGGWISSLRASRTNYENVTPPRVDSIKGSVKHTF